MADGLDSGHVFWNPEADMGNAEVWELIYPFVYIGRNSLPDSGGFGKFRGGTGHESYYMVWGTDFVYVSEIPMMPHSKILYNGGLFGGYPGMHFTDFLATDTNLKDRIDKQLPIPHKEGNPRNPDVFTLLEGNIRPIPHFYLTDPLKNYDLIAHRVISGCGGYGDPIERDLRLIRKDLANGLTSPETVKKINAVALVEENGSFEIREQETQDLRSSVREERKKKGRPVKEWWRVARERILDGKLDSHVIEMHKDCLKNSEIYKQEFLEFWALPAEFTF